uniref:disease resistance protein Roq1-like n=1 Tax=Erigeron canadensis TaxID=72917 RepID=UPI001CB90E59|nr:disease resistance protein Roq1-like [Erigeron canadensis]
MASALSYSQSLAPASYDVFLSFRGEDTRKTFVDHLYSALVQRLIHTYKDDETLPRGVSIGPSLLKAIKQSRIAVIIFSKNYADSSWCLDELEYIMKCIHETGLIVMPVFYDVDPSEVENQKGDFGNGFAKQKANNISKIESWRKALVDACNLSGWEPKNVANGHESKVIKEIADKIFDRLFPSNPNIDDGQLVGMRTRLQEIIAQLEMGLGDVQMVGIWGVGGSGKTTLANSVYTEISHKFEGSCIVENIREDSIKNGLKKLQEDILSSILNIKVVVSSIIEGKNKIKTMLCRRKVLIFLDDVDKLEQLQTLAGSHKWFGGGSRIIITTRDEHLLRAHKVNQVCPVRLLSDDEASQLFKIHAYNENNLVKGYEKLSLRVVSYASGLPLAVRVLGSFLCDKDETEWMSALDRLKDIPQKEIVETLKISYDGLDIVEKELFLDIACFFRFYTTKYAMEMLEAFGYHPCIGIKILREKALVTIGRNGMLDMHDLIQEMGHFIVRSENPDNPEKHSRVWKHEEISNMCSRGTIMENDKIEAIEYICDHDYDHDHDHSSCLCMIVSNMKRLRWLKVNIMDDKFDGGPSFLSNDLKYIHWWNYPTSPFPDSFQPVKLVVIKLDCSLQKELWMGYKHLPHLKVLVLRMMKNLLSTPDFKGLPCLQTFILHDSFKLEEIHPSLGNHTSIEYIQVSQCNRLRLFPTIVQMGKLKTLKIKECPAISEFPKIQANMESLVKLSLEGIGIEVLPSSIGECCTNLISLKVCGCSELKSIEFNLDALKHLSVFKCRHFCRISMLMFHHFPRSLRKLDLSDLDFRDGEIPSDIGELSNLQELYLSRNEFTRIDFSLSRLTQLKLLNLMECTRLVELPKLPSSLAILRAGYCKSVTTFGDCYKECKRLRLVSLMYGSVVNDGDRLLEFMLQENAIEDHSMLLELRGVEIPKGFIPRLCYGIRCTLQLPNNWSDDFCGFLICAVFTRGYRHEPVKISMRQPMSEGMDSRENDGVWEEGMQDTFTWVGYITFSSLKHTSWWDHTYNTLSFSIDEDRYKFCSGFGVRLVSRNIRDGRLRETLTNSSELSDYKPKFMILHDSAYALEISLGKWGP